MVNYGYGASLHPIDDTQMLREWRNDPGIRRWCREYRLITKGMQNQWQNGLDERNLMFSIKSESMKNHPGMYVGACGLTNISYVHRNAEFSIYIGSEFQRSGHAKAALQTLLNYGFGEVNLHRIWGESLYGNPAMGLYKTLGFRHEGIHTEAYFKDGKYHDSDTWSILQNEWDIVPVLNNL